MGRIGIKAAEAIFNTHRYNHKGEDHDGCPHCVTRAHEVLRTKNVTNETVPHWTRQSTEE